LRGGAKKRIYGAQRRSRISREIWVG